MALTGQDRPRYALALSNPTRGEVQGRAREGEKVYSPQPKVTACDGQSLAKGCGATMPLTCPRGGTM